MKRVFLLFFIVLMLSACSSQRPTENIEPVWSSGILEAEYGGIGYSAEVSFSENELIALFSKPVSLEGLTVKITNGSTEVMIDGLSLNYDNTMYGFLDDFYNAVRVSELTEIEYEKRDDTYISEFTSDNQTCTVILNKKDNSVIRFEMPGCSYICDKRGE